MGRLRSKRAQKIALVHVAKRDLGLDDETYRDALEQAAAKRSTADMDEAELDEVIDYFKAHGFHVKRSGGSRSAEPSVRFMQALWISLWQLGAIEDRTDAALTAFAKRQTAVDSLKWLTPEQANRVIEALKEMCARQGFDVPSAGKAANGDKGLAAKRALVLAIHAKLAAAGDPLAGAAAPAVDTMGKPQLEALADRLGTRLRKPVDDEAMS